MNWFCFFVVLVIAVPGLLIFKYGKPRGYLKDFLAWHLKPRSYSALERDQQITGPYILEDNDVLQKQSKGQTSVPETVAQHEKSKMAPQCARCSKCAISR